MKSFNYKLIVYLFFGLCFLFISFYTYYNCVIKQDGWVLGDWMINYEDGGFKRRGLSGSIILSLAEKIQISPAILVFLFVELLWLYFFLVIAVLVSRIKSDFLPVLFIFATPLTLLFTITSTQSIGRKEIILFDIFLTFILGKTYLKNTNVTDYLVALLLFVGVLIHEVFVFYIAFFLLYKFLNEEKRVLNYLILLFSVLLPAIIIFTVGKPLNNGATHSILFQQGVELSPGVIDHNEGFSTIKLYRENFLGTTLYVVSILIGFYYFNYITKLYGGKIRSYFILSGFNIVVMLALFYLATDWGRWVNIHFTLVTIYILSSIPDRSLELKLSRQSKHLILFLILINFFWQMDVCYDGFKLNYYLEILLTKIV